MTQTLQQAIDAVMELDGKRQDGAWRVNDQTAVGWMNNAIYIMGNKSNLARVYNDAHDAAENAAFIASSPQMAQIIRKQAAMIEGLREALGDVNDPDSLGCTRSEAHAALTTYNPATMTMEAL